jgi:MYXO-CTERM domain-containing protein
MYRASFLAPRCSALVAAVFVGCSPAPAPGLTPAPSPEPSVGYVSAALTDTDPVSAAVDTSCTTTSVKGLSTQLVAEIQCMRPGSMKSIEGAPGLALGSAVFPFLQTPAADALLAAQKARGTTLSINSALRTLPQQYLLYSWYKAGRCGISLAATPGNSNHEGAVAVDIEDSAGWRPSMLAAGFRWLGSSDPVHYDYLGKDAIDLGGLSVTAFQRLWNRNHPEDPIGEDGSYGPATATRVARAPVGGFPKGAEGCALDAGSPPPDAAAVADAAAPAPTPVAAEPPSGDDSGCTVSAAPRATPSAAGAVFAFFALVALGTRRRRRAHVSLS